MADIRLAKPAAGASESVQCAPDARFVFDFPTSDATLARDGDNLNISFQDGSQLQLQGFYQEYNGDNLPSFNIDGTEVAAADFFQAMNEPDLMPAAGPGTGTVANGARFHEWGDSALTGGLLHLEGLDWGFSRAFEWDDVPNAVGRNGDEGGLLYSRDDGGAAPANNPVTLTPENPGSVPPGTVVPPDGPENPTPGTPGNPGNHGIVPPGDVRLVSEAGLRDHDSVSVNGAMRVGAPDGLASIEVAGRVIWQNGHMLGNPQFATDEGYFHNFAYDAATGRLTYTYTLTDATTEHKLPGADHIAHSLPLTVRDVDGDFASSNITIIIRDDVAASTADTNTLTEGEQTEVTGNLLGNDTSGADGWMAGSLTLTDAAGNDLGATVEGTYGTLTIEPDGSYTYTLNDEFKGDGKALLPHDVQDEVFHYQVKDADGDVTSNTLTIDLVNVPLKPTGTDNPSDSGIEATSIDFELTDTAAEGTGVANQTLTADLFNGPQDVTSVVFATDQAITVDGAAKNNFTWQGQGTKTLVGTNGDGVTVTVTIGEVNADGTVEMTATMDDPAAHAANSNSISITGIAVTGTDAGGSTATNNNVSINIVDALPQSTADVGILGLGKTEVTGNLLANDTSGADGWMAASLTLTDADGNALGATVGGKYGTLTIQPDGSYTYTLNDKYKDGLPEDVDAEVFHYKVTDTDDDVTSNTLTIDLGIKFTLKDEDTRGADGATQTKSAALFAGLDGVTGVAFDQDQGNGITVDGAADTFTFTWDVSEDGQTLTGTSTTGEKLTVAIVSEANGKVSMTASMKDAAGHKSGSDKITISGIKVAATGEDDNTLAINNNVSISIIDDGPSITDVPYGLGGVDSKDDVLTLKFATFDDGVHSSYKDFTNWNFSLLMGDSNGSRPIFEPNDQNYSSYLSNANAYVGTYGGIQIMPTFVEYIYEDGKLDSSKDIHNAYKSGAARADKILALGPNGLTVGKWGNGYDEQGLSMPDADHSEALVFENISGTIYYGTNIEFGGFGESDKALICFYLTPRNSNDDSLVRMVEVSYNDLDDPEKGIKYIPVPDGYTKVIISAAPDSAGGTNSGFGIKSLGFTHTAQQYKGKVDCDFGADGQAEEGAITWDWGTEKEFNFKILTGPDAKDSFGEEITYTANLTTDGTHVKATFQLGDTKATLFEGDLNADGTWTIQQFYEFEKTAGGASFDVKFTVEDADGDTDHLDKLIDMSNPSDLERFHHVETGYYENDWGMDENTVKFDNAYDLLRGHERNDLMYGKGGNDLMLGDGLDNGEDSPLGELLKGLDLDLAFSEGIGTGENNIGNGENSLGRNEGATGPNKNAFDGVQEALLSKPAEELNTLMNAIEKGEQGDDALYGGAGDDILFGGGGDDYLDGNGKVPHYTDSDMLFGGSGNDIIVYDQNDRLIHGGDGNDLLLAGMSCKPTLADMLAGEAKDENGQSISMPKVYGIEVLLKATKTDHVENFGITSHASLQLYGIVLGENGLKLAEEIWKPLTAEDGTQVKIDGYPAYTNADGTLQIQTTPDLNVELVPKDELGKTSAVSETEDVDTVALVPAEDDADADSGAQLFAMRRSAPSDEDEGDAGHTASAPAAGGSAAAGKSVIEGHEDEPNTLFGTDGDDVIIGGSASDFIDGGAGSDTIYAGAGDDLIVYDPTDYLIDGGEGIDFLLAGDAQASLGQLLNVGNGENGMPIVNNVEVLLKGVDTASLTSMDKLAEKFGLTLEKGPDGQDRLMVDKSQWDAGDGPDANGVTTWTNTADSSITMETTLQQTSEAEGQAVLTAKVAAETGGNN